MIFNKGSIKKIFKNSAKFAAAFGVIMTLGIWANSLLQMIKVYIEKYLQNKWIDI